MNHEKAQTNGPITILLIDDEPGVLLALKLLMQAVGYGVRDFSSPLEAVEFLKGPGECDVIICDLKMPKLNGIGVLQEAKRIRPTLPFILMSGHAQVPEIEQANQFGSSGFLGKPFTPTQLKELIGKVC
jgi:DNA-binding NtrC family response regulator